LIERWTKWDSHKIPHTLVIGDRVAVFGGGIGLVSQIDGDEMFYTPFNQGVVYRKKLKDVVWNERNWRWETTGLGSGHKMDAKRHQKCSPPGGDRCHS
jgi:hypothetical protein